MHYKDFFQKYLKKTEEEELLDQEKAPKEYRILFLITISS